MIVKIIFTLSFVFAVYRQTSFFHHYIPNTVSATENLAVAMGDDFSTIFSNQTTLAMYSYMRKILRNVDHWMENDMAKLQK